MFELQYLALLQKGFGLTMKRTTEKEVGARGSGVDSSLKSGVKSDVQCVPGTCTVAGSRVTFGSELPQSQQIGRHSWNS